LSPAPQGTGSDWKNLPRTAQFLSTQTEPVPPTPPGPSPPVLAPSPPGRPSGPPPARSFPARPPLPRSCWPLSPVLHQALPSPTPKTLHREGAVTERIFQALPTRTDRHCNFNI
jgi:hypothetical protein